MTSMLDATADEGERVALHNQSAMVRSSPCSRQRVARYHKVNGARQVANEFAQQLRRGDGRGRHACVLVYTHGQKYNHCTKG